jgi:glutamine synthetase
MNMEEVINKPAFDFNPLDQHGNTIVEYVWIGGTGLDIRCKAKTYSKPVNSLEDVDEWNYDGSSTYQATTESSEVTIRPVALFNDPFRGAPNKIVLCSAYHADGTPTNTNFRHFAEKIFKQTEAEDPWFGMEQEYIFVRNYGRDLVNPLGWPRGGFPKPQGQYYCSIGSSNNIGREVMEAHYKACLNAGVKIYGTNAEVMLGQWEFQVGTCRGIEAADHLWMARFLLRRVGEFYGVDVNFDPKPVLGDWNGSGCHTNYSTNGTRAEGGIKVVYQHLENLGKTHQRLVSIYGENNQHRLTGKLFN